MLLNLLAPRQRHPAAQSFASTIRHLGALGLFFLAIVDSSPIPAFGSADILTAVLSASHRNPWFEYAATATAGSMIGAYITFRLAHKAGSAYLESRKGIASKLPMLFKKWGIGALAASAAIPIPSPTSMFFAAAGASVSAGKVSCGRCCFAGSALLGHRPGGGPLRPPLHSSSSPSHTILGMVAGVYRGDDWIDCWWDSDQPKVGDGARRVN